MNKGVEVGMGWVNEKEGEKMEPIGMGDLEGARVEIRLGRMDPDYGVPKALESSSRLLSRKSDRIKMVFKESFSVQAEFHMTPLTQKDFKAEPSTVQIEREPGSGQWWL